MVTKNSTTITLTGTEQTVQFDRSYPYFWVHNLGDGDVSISMDSGIVEGADGVITVPAGGSCCTMHGYPADKLYLLGGGKVQVMGTGSAFNPFKTSWKGGVDGTLSKAGYAADAKATGDNIADINDNISFLGARVDNIATLPGGSTTADAELADIRVGAGGNTYPNAGTAVRTQVSELKEDLSELESETIGLICSGDGNGLVVFTEEKKGTINEGYVISPSSGEMTTVNSNIYRVRDYRNLSKKHLRVKCYANYGNYYYSFLDSSWKCLGGKKETSNTSYVSMINEIIEVPDEAVVLLVGEISPNIGGAFDSGIALSKKWEGKKWTCVGDSLTEKNSRTTKNYHDYIAENTGVTVVNMGVSGTGYKRGDNNGNAFYQRISNVPTDSDVITIFGSGNDMGAGVELGTPTDSGTNTLCGCINTTIDNLIAIMPTVQLGLITPTPWNGYNPSIDNPMKEYANAIIEICKARSIPCLDLYHCSNLRPWAEEGRNACYTKDGGNGVHPDEIGHKIIASRFKSFLDSLII